MVHPQFLEGEGLDRTWKVESPVRGDCGPMELVLSFEASMLAGVAVIRLRVELLSTRALLWFASVGRDVELKPETHLYLANLHFRLAAAYDSAGNPKRSKKHRGLGTQHASAGDPEPPCPAAAMAMPVPQPFTFTDVRGLWIDPADPDDVA